MKQTLTTSQATHILIDDKSANWSRSGAYALIKYLEELESDTGEEMELDTCAIRCDYAEYANLADFADDYFGDDSDWRIELSVRPHWYDTEKEENCVREYIQDHGTLIEFEGGIIVSSF